MDTAGIIDSVMLAKLGGGALAGVAVGYALKRATKIALFVVGLLILLLYGLMKADLIAVRWDAVGQSLEQGSRGLTAMLVGLFKDLSASLVGFAGGFFVGMKIR